MSKAIQHLLSIKDLSPDLVPQLFARTEKLKRLRGVLSQHEKILEGETVVTMFWETSTRTRVSFSLAANRLGAQVVDLAPKGSSVEKGESLDDTIANLRALGCRMFVVRHPTSGEVDRLKEKVGRGTYLINAGDGTHEHPTQALLDAFTIRERKKTFEGLEVAIVGDIVHSRVAHSGMILLSQLGARIRVSGPSEMLPSQIDIPNVNIIRSADTAIEGADVVMALRLQKERSGFALKLTDSDYRSSFGLTPERVAKAKPDAIVLHPGPINRGVEIDSEVADGPQSVILRQAENGLFMRMAIFEALRGELG